MVRFRFPVENVSLPDTAFVRVALYNDDTDGDDDLDLYVYSSLGGSIFEPLAESTNDDSDEFVEFPLEPNAAAIELIVDVHGYDTDPVAGGSGAVFDLSVWRLQRGGTPVRLNVTAPVQAVRGTTQPVTAQWQNLGSGRYLGGIEHRDDAGPLSDSTPFTTIDVFVPEPDPAP